MVLVASDGVVGCVECEKIVPDGMGYASLFHAGTLGGVVLPKRSAQFSDEWESFPPNANICQRDLARLPREKLRTAPDGIAGTIYGLQSNSVYIITLLLGVPPHVEGDSETYRRETNTFRFLSEDDTREHFPNAVKHIEQILAERVAASERTE